MSRRLFLTVFVAVNALALTGCFNRNQQCMRPSAPCCPPQPCCTPAPILQGAPSGMITAPPPPPM